MLLAGRRVGWGGERERECVRVCVCVCTLKDNFQWRSLWEDNGMMES